MCEILIPARHGAAIDVKEGQTIAVVDIEGAQVVDFFAESLVAGFFSSEVSFLDGTPLWSIAGASFTSKFHFSFCDDDVEGMMEKLPKPSDFTP